MYQQVASTLIIYAHYSILIIMLIIIIIYYCCCYASLAWKQRGISLSVYSVCVLMGPRLLFFLLHVLSCWSLLYILMLRYLFIYLFIMEPISCCSPPKVHRLQLPKFSRFWVLSLKTNHQSEILIFLFFFYLQAIWTNAGQVT